MLPKKNDLSDERSHEKTESPDRPTIETRIEQLASHDVLIVQPAREALVTWAGAAVPALLRALHNNDAQIRWEAARVLGEIGDPASAPALVNALMDDDFVVRWIASEALTHLGATSLVPLLRALETNSSSVWLRKGAHRVLRVQASGQLAPALDPVLRALDDVEPALAVPIACAHALDALAQTAEPPKKE